MIRALSLGLVLGAVMALAPVAEATFPGTNGRLVRVGEQNGNGDIIVEQPTENITNSAADDRSPAWNRDTVELAYSSNRGSDPAGDYEIYKQAAHGSAAPVQLTNNTVDDRQPSWSPTGTQLVIVRETSGHTQLMILAADGSGTATPLTPAGVFDPVDPNWSADGSRIAFAAFEPGVSQYDIFTVRPDGTGLTNVTNTPFLDDREPNWAPGNARIAYSNFFNSNWDIHVINAGGTGDTNITNYPGANDRDPVWSPDATRIAFTTRRQFNQDTIINIASTGQFPVTVATGTAPDWAPAACSDGLDNDGDGATDYPNDPGCDQPSDPDEANPQCSDDLDNDGDGATDYPDDIGCISDADNDETNPQCSDGLDNDGDTKIDYPQDPGCASATDNSEFNAPPPACSDGIDNDGDTKVDYPADPGCFSASDNDESNPPPPACSDGVDNDGDTKVDYPADPGCTSSSDNDESNSPTGTFVRPKSAPSVKVSLVPAFNACVSPNRQHGPPLAFPSCNPPAQASSSVTVGTEETNGAGENSVGNLSLKADAGVPGPPEDSDVILQSSVTDVRCRGTTTSCGSTNGADGADYTGQLQGSATIRITDRFNATSAGGGPDAATVVDIPFPINHTCAATAATTIGSTCTSNSSFSAIVPNAIRDGKRSVLDIGQVLVSDGGNDGNIATAPNTLFLTQGLFVP